MRVRLFAWIHLLLRIPQRHSRSIFQLRPNVWSLKPSLANGRFRAYAQMMSADMLSFGYFPKKAQLSSANTAYAPIPSTQEDRPMPKPLPAWAQCDPNL